MLYLICDGLDFCLYNITELFFEIPFEVGDEGEEED